MKAVTDFNYKVALASGLKHLQGGKLRQAEEQFRYLISKFPAADGGYRGLARVQIELGDRAAALAALRDGAAALARAGDRPGAIDLLHEAVALDPLDLAAHRRLAAALALTGDAAAAASEYARSVQAELAAGDPQRARLEVAYAIETIGDLPSLRELAASLGIATPARGPAPAAPMLQPERAPAPLAPAPPLAAAPRRPEPDLTRPAPVVIPAAPLAGEDALQLEARATELLSSRDPRAAVVGIAAARALVAEGKTHAASDLLLHLIAAGIAVHEAQRELVTVTRALGRDDIADERERLLTEAVAGG